MDLSYRVLAPLFMDMAVIFLLTGMIFNTTIFRKRGRTDDRLFFGLLLIDTLVALFDMAGYYVDGKHFPGSYGLNLLFLHLYYMLLLLFACLWVLYLDYRVYQSSERTKQAAKVLGVPVVLMEILYLAGIPGRWFFYVDEADHYRYGPGYIFPVLLMIAYGIAGLILILLYAKKHTGSQQVPYILFLLPIIVALVVSYGLGGVSMVPEGLAAMLAYLHTGTMNEAFFNRGDGDVQ